MPTLYTVYIIRNLNPNVTDSYVGMTKCFKNRKNAHKTSVNNVTARTALVDRHIAENGGWNKWLMHPYKTNIETKEQAMEIEEEIRQSFRCNLNTNRSSCDSVENIGEYMQNWHADYKMQNGISYMAKWTEKNPDYFREWRERNKPPPPTTRNEKILRAWLHKIGSINNKVFDQSFWVERLINMSTYSPSQK